MGGDASCSRITRLLRTCYDAPTLDRAGVGAYLRGVDASRTREASTLQSAAAEPMASTATRVRRRRLPSQQEQARRKAQMKALGDKTGRLIREAIARSER